MPGKYGSLGQIDKEESNGDFDGGSYFEALKGESQRSTAGGGDSEIYGVPTTVPATTTTTTTTSNPKLNPEQEPYKPKPRGVSFNDFGSTSSGVNNNMNATNKNAGNNNNNNSNSNSNTNHSNNAFHSNNSGMSGLTASERHQIPVEFLDNYDAASAQSNYLEDVPLPVKMAPLLKRLTDLEDLSDADILSILFIVRVADAMHRCSYATFLTRSFVEELGIKLLDVDELELEIEPSALRWSFRQGAWSNYHRISVDYDGSAMQQLSKLALGVLDDSIGVETALRDISKMEEWQFTGLEGFVREFPGRIVIVPTLAMTGSVVYFRGTLTDMACCCITGIVAGLIHYTCSVRFPQLAGVQDILVSIATAMVATASLVIFPNSTCFSAQILGTLFWFLYGISFMLSIYEMTQSLVLTGLTRFAVAVLNSFILAFGVVIGVWLSFYGGPDRFDRILEGCDHLEYQIDASWYNYLYPIIALGALMQMRVAPKFWLICLITQLVAVQSQYYLDTVWKQPLFVFNFLPAYLATLTAHVMIVVGQKFNWTQLVVKRTAYASTPSPKKKALPVRDLSLYRKMGGGSERVFKSIRWADDRGGLGPGGFGNDGGIHSHNKSMRGGYERTSLYERENRFHYQRSDLWFCLVPALYLLVPGSSVWKFAFFSIIDAAFDDGHTASLNENNFSLQSMISSVFVVAIGQTLGVRLALVTLWVVNTVWTSQIGTGSSHSSVRL